jgi:probable rRNA maturation factor
MPEGASTLLFEHPSRRIRRRELRLFLANLAQRLGKGRAVTCLITRDRRLRAMNRTFRGKDYVTDVLSFPANYDCSSHQGSLGELAISLDRAAHQAAALGHSVEEELRLLILHGMLHLAGLDHETDRGEMARAEIRWRKRLGLPVGLVERGSIIGVSTKKVTACRWC